MCKNVTRQNQSVVRFWRVKFFCGSIDCYFSSLLMLFMIRIRSLSSSCFKPSTAFLINSGLDTFSSKNSEGVIPKYSQIANSSVSGGNDFPEDMLNISSAVSQIVAHLIFRNAFLQAQLCNSVFYKFFVHCIHLCIYFFKSLMIAEILSNLSGVSILRSDITLFNFFGFFASRSKKSFGVILRYSQI